MEWAGAGAGAVIFNCVINLVSHKEAVYREVFRVLRPVGHTGMGGLAGALGARVPCW